MSSIIANATSFRGTSHHDRGGLDLDSFVNDAVAPIIVTTTSLRAAMIPRVSSGASPGSALFALMVAKPTTIIFSASLAVSAERGCSRLLDALVRSGGSTRWTLQSLVINRAGNPSAATEQNHVHHLLARLSTQTPWLRRLTLFRVSLPPPTNMFGQRVIEIIADELRSLDELSLLGDYFCDDWRLRQAGHGDSSSNNSNSTVVAKDLLDRLCETKHPLRRLDIAMTNRAHGVIHLPQNLSDLPNLCELSFEGRMDNGGELDKWNCNALIKCPALAKASLTQSVNFDHMIGNNNTAQPRSNNHDDSASPSSRVLALSGVCCASLTVLKLALSLPFDDPVLLEGLAQCSGLVELSLNLQTSSRPENCRRFGAAPFAALAGKLPRLESISFIVAEALAYSATSEDAGGAAAATQNVISPLLATCPNLKRVHLDLGAMMPDPFKTLAGFESAVSTQLSSIDISVIHSAESSLSHRSISLLSLASNPRICASLEELNICGSRLLLVCDFASLAAATMPNLKSIGFRRLIPWQKQQQQSTATAKSPPWYAAFASRGAFPALSSLMLFNVTVRSEEVDDPAAALALACLPKLRELQLELLPVTAATSAAAVFPPNDQTQPIEQSAFRELVTLHVGAASRTIAGALLSAIADRATTSIPTTRFVAHAVTVPVRSTAETAATAAAAAAETNSSDELCAIAATLEAALTKMSSLTFFTAPDFLGLARLPPLHLCRYLVEIDLSRNRNLRINSGEKDQARLREVARRCTSLKELTLNFCLHVSCLGALGESQSLRILTCTDSLLDDNGVCGLERAPSLRMLDISINPRITKQALVTLANGCRQLTTLNVKLTGLREGLGALMSIPRLRQVTASCEATRSGEGFMLYETTAKRVNVDVDDDAPTNCEFAARKWIEEQQSLKGH